MSRRAVVAVAVALLTASACSGGGASGDVPEPEVEVDSAVDAGDTAGSEPSDADFCAAISAIQTAEFELEETFGPEARTLFADVQRAAPDEISEDVATVVATLEAIAEIGISADEDDPEAVDEAFEILLDPEFTEANENLEAYTSQACGIDLGEESEGEIGLEDLDDLGV